MGSSNSIVVGTRGSPLALAQTQEVISQLAAKLPGLQFDLRQIRTKGDIVKRTPLPKLGGKGIFVKELESALLASEIDIAVHSFKDLPTELAHGLTIAAITQRLDARDALISKSGAPLDMLPFGAVVGTSSPRRAVQLLSYRPDLNIVDLRGNLDTRLGKVSKGVVDAAVLAAAGLMRLGWQDKITQYLPLDISLPAVGQGALAIEIRQDEEKIAEMVSSLDHGPTRQAITAERACLQHLGGGCNIPIAVFGQASEGILHLQGMVASSQGNNIIRSGLSGDVNMGEGLGHLLARRLLVMGADKILAEEAP